MNEKFEEAAANEGWQNIVTEGKGIRDNVKTLLRMKASVSEDFWASPMMADAAMVIDAAFMAAEGEIDNLVDVLVNGNDEGDSISSVPEE